MADLGQRRHFLLAAATIRPERGATLRLRSQSGGMAASKKQLLKRQHGEPAL